MAFKINGVTVLDDNREVTVDKIIATANDRVFVGVTATNSPTSVLSPSIFQGSVSGYTSGGDAGPALTNVVDKFPFASDTNATDVGDLTIARNRLAGQSSTTHGYSSGGGPPFVSIIDKFPFNSDTNATGVGNLTQARGFVTGQSSSTHGYSSAGLITPPPTGTQLNTIDKFPFAHDVVATDVGNVTEARNGPAGQSSTTHGYTSGGNPGPTGFGNTIDKFPFAADTNATNVGDISSTLRDTCGQSSTTSGYTSGGFTGARINTIDKFPFSTDTNATDVGDLTQAREIPGSQSSTSSGYTSGGYTGPPSGFQNTIDKFPFSSDSNATDVGDLSVTRISATGQQARTIQ